MVLNLFQVFQARKRFCTKATKSSGFKRIPWWFSAKPFEIFSKKGKYCSFGTKHFSYLRARVHRLQHFLHPDPDPIGSGSTRRALLRALKKFRTNGSSRVLRGRSFFKFGRKPILLNWLLTQKCNRVVLFYSLQMKPQIQINE